MQPIRTNRILALICCLMVAVFALAPAAAAAEPAAGEEYDLAQLPDSTNSEPGKQSSKPAPATIQTPSDSDGAAIPLIVAGAVAAVAAGAGIWRLRGRGDQA